MKKLLIISIILIIWRPAEVLSHPGGTDRHGGHKCRKDCAGWHLDTGEYHLHDDNGNPIRLEKREEGDILKEPKPVGESRPAPAETTEIKESETLDGVNWQIPRNTQEIRYDSIQRSDTLIAFPNLLLLLMLIVLLLLLVLKRRKKNGDE